MNNAKNGGQTPCVLIIAAAFLRWEQVLKSTLEYRVKHSPPRCNALGGTGPQPWIRPKEMKNNVTDNSDSALFNVNYAGSVHSAGSRTAGYRAF
ncbi:hypothetical protein KH388_06080 [Serratia rubidaea]|nr:hypothetical protein [Serratia rubidaea]